ncbi:hypothetical protein [Cytobacillus pseudoceanisediminis]|uniref:hypothetical protein n=1 Tax=Cytobacillus pseudoceanisediminis TaxID=3051614 RepID=UPI003C2E6807
MATKTNTRYRNVRRSSFTTISNRFLRDSEVTLQAKGLLSIFLSNHEDWEINMKEIISRSKNGRDAQYKVVNELIKHGYFARVEVRSSVGGGFEGIEYIFSDEKEDVQAELNELEQWAIDNSKEILVEYMDRQDKKKKKKADKTPHTENQDTVVNPHTENQDTENQDTGLQDTESRDTESQYINNIKEKNTNSNKTNSNKNLNPNHNHQEIDLYELLWDTQLPQSLKNKIKVMLSTKKISLTSDQIIDIEGAYIYQQQKGYITPDCDYDDTSALNDLQFTQTVGKMLETVEDIRNIKGLIKEWVEKAFTYKKDQYYVSDLADNNNIAFYDWLNQ